MTKSFAVTGLAIATAAVVVIGVAGIAAAADAPAAASEAAPSAGGVLGSSGPKNPGGTRKRLNNSSDPLLALTPPLRGSTVAAPGSAPPIADPRDFTGVWWLKGYEYMLGPESGVPPPLKPEYMKVLERRIRAKNRGTPEADASTNCMPHGMPRLMESPYPITVVQTPGMITFLHEVAHNVRRIYLNRGHLANYEPSFLGDSVAHWEGDTLVVDTTGLNDKTFIDDEGSSHSTKEHVVERYTKIDGGNQLELVMTVEDPVTLEHSYSYRRLYQWRPDVHPMEYSCEENNRNAPVNGVTQAK